MSRHWLFTLALHGERTAGVWCRWLQHNGHREEFIWEGMERKEDEQNNGSRVRTNESRQ